MRGSILDMFLIIIVVFGMAAILLFSGYLSKQIQSSLNSTAGMSPAEVAQTNTLFTKGEAGLHTVDYMLIGVFAFLSLGAIISAFWIQTHPAFFVVFLVVNLFLVMIAGQLRDIYTNISADPMLASTATVYPLSANVITNLPLITLIVSAIIAIVMYGKPPGATYETR